MVRASLLIMEARPFTSCFCAQLPLLVRLNVCVVLGRGDRDPQNPLKIKDFRLRTVFTLAFL